MRSEFARGVSIIPAEEISREGIIARQQVCYSQVLHPLQACQCKVRKIRKRCSGEQVDIAQGRQLEAFKSSIPSLQVVASFACSVASLSRSPAFQLPGHHHLHDDVLADHQFDWGGLSTCTSALAQCLLPPSPSQNLQELPPSIDSCSCIFMMPFKHHLVKQIAFIGHCLRVSNACSTDDMGGSVACKSVCISAGLLLLH